MNTYDEVLSTVLDNLLASKNCEVVDDVLRQSMLELLRGRFREIANRTTNWSNHAGRCAPSYFDLERTFMRMNIRVGELKAMYEGQPDSLALVECKAPETQDQDFHSGPPPILSSTKAMVLASTAYIPDYLPPFPGAHTYKNSPIEKVTDRSYVAIRNRHAENELSTQKALNQYYLRCNPNISLFEETQRDGSGHVLDLGLPKKLPYSDALMPRNEVFDTDIYAPIEVITHKALDCRFLEKPKLHSSRPSPGNFEDEDVEMEERCSPGGLGIEKPN
ncbi:transcription initiation factor TFIID subunit 8 [Drosophila simulans]|uniref:Transcription initiation factor TFIID subunit 8 n=1 Tax=Drosophila simulans TaxID=7240 RepID=B4QK36_DROSI|nr:transcription initiation factor TFIID subunit 8 [Drosophila simulans]EDX11373.1 GD12120 [Drosophila simulans]KMZ00994.1 uncharacterized protein Dsimw501_GD12120 [Drosophila simulans]